MEIIVICAGILFGICMMLITAFAFIFGISYEEASVIINLWIQPGLLIISTGSIVYAHLKKRNYFYSFFGAIYFIITCMCFYRLYHHYHMWNMSEAFKLCMTELWDISKIAATSYNIYYLPHYTYIWTEYYIINILIFIVGFCSILIINRILRKLK
jgi:hypothetical protein